jgi:NAD-dependent dihydropyrimidine dehydrogenase PreA subunit
MKTIERTNTLLYSPKLCNNCGMCSMVCPQGVFAPGERVARMVDRNACIECGACLLNCEPGAIQVQAGVGCAAAMIRSALTGQKEVSCEPDGGSDCGCSGESSGGCCG